MRAVQAMRLPRNDSHKTYFVYFKKKKLDFHKIHKKRCILMQHIDKYFDKRESFYQKNLLHLLIQGNSKFNHLSRKFQKRSCD